MADIINFLFVSSSPRYLAEAAATYKFIPFV